MTPPPEAEKLCRSIINSIAASSKRRAGVEANPEFQRKMAELERLGMHDAWRRQIEAELKKK